MNRMLTLTPIRHEAVGAAGDPRAARPGPGVAERARGVRVPTRDRITYQLASLLLEYPTEELVDRVPMLREAATAGGWRANRVNRPVLPLLDRLATGPLSGLQAEYVATFDLRRRCCLHLTYYAYGDTRRRGAALLRLKQAYAAAGGRLAGDELPDHLSVLLEFAATVDPAVGRVLLLDHRAGIELLRISLTERRSPYAGVVEAVLATLPRLTGDGKDVVARLIAEGPPDEEVGFEAMASGSHPWVPAPEDGMPGIGATPRGGAAETRS